MVDTPTILRLLAAGALAGLLVFCGAHVVQVWRKRNAKKGLAPAAHRPGRKLAWAGLVVGLGLVPTAGLMRELTQAEGVLSGEDLYVVRARDDLAVEWLHESELAGAGEPLARFGSSPSAAKADELRARLARAEAERDVLALSPLVPDPELTRRHQRAAQERAQVQQELGLSVTAAETAERDVNAQLQAKKEALAKLAGLLAERRKDLDRANIRLAHHRELNQAYEVGRSRGAVTASEYQEHLKGLKDAEAEVANVNQEIKAGAAEKEVLASHVARLEAKRDDPLAPLRTQLAGLRDRLAKLEKEEADLKAALDRDAARSAKLRAAELSQASAKVRECQATVAALAGGQEARAPFAGRVAYRAPSPNAVRPGGALLVLGPENGALLTARLARSEADALRDSPEVVLEVGDGPERRVPARFRGARDLAHEPGQAALQLECQPPPEVVRRLAEGEKLTVAFGWRPPLVGMWSFRFGLLLAVGSVCGLYLTRRRQSANGALVPVPAAGLVEVPPRTQVQVARPAPAHRADPEEMTLLLLEQLAGTDVPVEAKELLGRLHALRALRNGHRRVQNDGGNHSPMGVGS